MQQLGIANFPLLDKPEVDTLPGLEGVPLEALARLLPPLGREGRVLGVAFAERRGTVHGLFLYSATVVPYFESCRLDSNIMTIQTWLAVWAAAATPP